ncbi:hypothetical protein HDK77DRAFT_77818 [Phyllosticta capitalensis]
MLADREWTRGRVCSGDKIGPTNKRWSSKLTFIPRLRGKFVAHRSPNEKKCMHPGSFQAPWANDTGFHQVFCVEFQGVVEQRVPRLSQPDLPSSGGRMHPASAAPLDLPNHHQQLLHSLLSYLDATPRTTYKRTGHRQWSDRQRVLLRPDGRPLRSLNHQHLGLLRRAWAPPLFPPRTTRRPARNITHSVRSSSLSVLSRQSHPPRP